MSPKLSSYSLIFVISLTITNGISVNAKKIDFILEKDFKKIEENDQEDKKTKGSPGSSKTIKTTSSNKGTVSSRKNSNSNASSSNNMGSLSSISSLQDSPPEMAPSRERARPELPSREFHEERLEE